MPGTITSDLVTIDAADATTNWLPLGTWSTAQAVNDDPRIQGTNCLEGRNSNNTGWSLASHAGLNLSSTYHIFIWMNNNCTAASDIIANGGQAISISSDTTPTIVGTTPNNGPTNSKSWWVNGSDGIKTGGWICFVVSPTSTPNNSQGAIDLTSVKRMGFRAKTISAISTKTKNILWDAVRYGTSLNINDGTTLIPVTLSDIIAVDSSQTNAWGIITNVSDIYYLAGKLNIGTDSQSASTSFKDTNQVVVYRNFPVNNDFYEIKLAGTTSFQTTGQLGNYSAGVASDGVSIKGAGNTASTNHAVWTLTADSSNTVFKSYACAFSELKSGILNSNSEIRNSVFNNFGTVTPNSGALFSNTFQNLKTGTPINATYGLIINYPYELSRVVDNKFINCNRVLKITKTGEYNLDKNIFSSNIYDIENATDGPVIVNNISGSNASSYINTAGGTTTINTITSFSLTNLKTNTEIRIYRVSDDVEIAGTENSSNTFVYNYNYISDTPVYIRIHSLTYVPMSLNITLGNTNQSIPIDQQLDRVYNNPI